MTCGIYKIVNQKNNKYYLGSSKNIEKRWQTHKRTLKKNTHHNIHLQRAWNKYGENSFLLNIAEITTEKKILNKEQYYLDKLKPPYNIGTQASGGDNLTNNPNKDKIIKQITKTLRDKISKMSKEEKSEKWSRPMDKNPNWKGGKTYFTCPICGIKKRTCSLIKTCAKCYNKNKNGINNPFYGKHHSKKTINILRQKTIERGNSCNKQKISVIIDNIKYSSMSTAAKKLNINRQTVANRIKSKKFPNYIISQ
jgi:group I intron endonuclease